MTEEDFIPLSLTDEKIDGKVRWKAPSNIALVKYWGKKENQIPANPSFSFTLDKCVTSTSVGFRPKDKKTNDFSFDLSFEGSPKESFKPKIQTFFERVERFLPFLKDYHLEIETSNSFPHSSGIASSASGMAALALCLMEMESKLNPKMDDLFFKRKASFLARLGSGSACRSIEGDLVQWGHHSSIKGSSDLYGIQYPDRVHQVFKGYQDTILLVHKGKKQVSSTVGHNLMHDHHYAKQRFVQAGENLSTLRAILAEGDLASFINIVESEALTLHAMMMTSLPYFILMKPNTLSIIEKVWEFRAASGAHICFTLDAGANVHLLYPEYQKEQINTFIQEELVVYCEKGQYICDEIGLGAQKGTGS